MSKKFIFQTAFSEVIWLEDCDSIEEAAENERGEHWYKEWDETLLSEFSSPDEELYSTLIELTAEEVIGLDKEGRYLGSNQKALVKEAKKLLMNNPK